MVSDGNMHHNIHYDGDDELTRLSYNVEQMRSSMLKNIQLEREARDSNAELITSMSHDIRTPLTVLLGYLEMMKNHEGCDEEMTDYIEASENTAMRLKQLSDDMLKYSLAFGDAPGDVTLEDADASRIKIETTTGDVTGNILTDKIIFADATTGNIDIPRLTSGGRCDISTTTGDIKITIGKE